MKGDFREGAFTGTFSLAAASDSREDWLVEKHQQRQNDSLWSYH